MTITVIAANRMGILSRLAVALGRADLRIERQSRSELEADRVSFVFSVAGGQLPAALGETLRGIPHVLEVTIEGGAAQQSVSQQNVSQRSVAHPTAAQPAATQAATAAPTLAFSLQNEVDALSRSYPNLVGGVRDAQQRLPLDAAGWRDLGERVGGELAVQGTVKPVRTDSVAFALERLVLPAVKSFSLAKVTGTKLSITVNPFSQGVSSPGVSCFFLAGLISGLLKSAIPTATATEESCRAAGDPACTFVATLY